MAQHEEAVQRSDFKDRKTGLVVFGILEIILGALCGLATLGMIVSTFLIKNSGVQMRTGSMIPGILLYAILAVWLIWMGIGSIKARRWARALLLVSSWICLIGGIGGLIFMMMFMPGMSNQSAQSGQTPQAMAVIFKYVMIVFMAFFLIIIPGVLVLFYGRRDVKATCEARDLKVRWTDKCPLPVLAVSLIYGFWAVSLLWSAAYGWAIPFFGFILSGTAGAVISLIYLLLFGYVAWGAYKLNIKAWWCAMLATIAQVASVGITFSRGGLWALYEKMNISGQQLEAMKQYVTPHISIITLLFVIWIVGFLGYLFYTKRYFVSPSTHEGVL
jgi:hypothetical protein